MSEPDNTDTRGQDLIASSNATRDSRDPAASESSRSTPTPTPTSLNTPPTFEQGFSTPQAFSVPMSAFDMSGSIVPKEDISRVVVDVLRNTSINGVYPNVTGNNIDYPVLSNNTQTQWAQANWSDQNLSNLTLSTVGRQSDSVVYSNIKGVLESLNSSTRSEAIPISSSQSESVKAGAAPIATSQAETVKAGAAPIATSQAETVKAGAAPVATSQSENVKAGATPIATSQVETANSKARPVIDSNKEVANTNARPLSESAKVLANPPANTMLRRRSNESANDTAAVTPIYVRSADKKSAMVLYLHDAHTISIDPDTTVGDTITDSISKEKIAPSNYFLSADGSSSELPFKITVQSGTDPKYKVSYNSSIINGTNGGPFNISGLNVDKSITQQKFIIAEADVTENPFQINNAGFTIKEVDSNETDEVKVENGKQTKLRLLIGKITVENIDGGGKLLRPWQAVTTSFKTVVSFHNGAVVYTLQAAPTHQSRV